MVNLGNMISAKPPAAAGKTPGNSMQLSQKQMIGILLLIVGLILIGVAIMTW